MKRKTYIIFIIMLFASMATGAQVRKSIELKNWQFHHPGEEWQNVRVPHDWAISGEFDKDIDKQIVAIVQNGEKKATEKTGRTGSLPWIGQGEYKTTFNVPEGYENTEIIFDGVMSEPEVFVNGNRVGEWKCGYNAFKFDLTTFTHAGANDLLVKCNNRPESSRWYPGAGIYRPVKLVFRKHSEGIRTWATFSYTKTLDAAGNATQHYETMVSKNAKYVVATILDNNGNKVSDSRLLVNNEGRAKGEFSLAHPHLWTPETPYLYNITTEAFDSLGNLLDVESMEIGIRTVNVTKEHGFQLNGRTRKIKGVCLHHDLGPLGAAVNKAALIRQVRILKDMGCDAIRTSHNMPSTMQMEVYDSLGMMVMAESFDMWKYPKCKNGYALFFDEWADRDIENLVLNHRNHASNIMWSIGNEIPEQGSKEGAVIAKRLQDLCHRLDPSRMVTSGMDRSTAAIKSGFAAVLDIPGYNYRLPKYEEAYRLMPQGFLLGSETASTISSRGVYKFPVEAYKDKKYNDLQCSSYDMECCNWSNLPDDDWYWQDDKDWVIGEFVWTGFDYLGEPTPYDDFWPSRSSYFGICDLAGLPKDRYFLYRSRWNTDTETIHLLPHWSFRKEQLGKTTPVYCYTSYPTAELFVNGKSQGKITKSSDYDKYDRYRLRWNDVKFKPGEIIVKVFDASGAEKGSKTIKTAKQPREIVLKSDRETIQADGDDIAFIEVEMLDKNGTFCPDADEQLEFFVQGAGKFQAACNGDATSTECFCKPTMKLFKGRLVILVRSVENQRGEITLTVKSKNKNIKPKSITITSL